MKISKNLLAAGFLIIAMLVTESSLALTLGSQSIAEAYQSSDVVIIGIVQSQEINRVNDTLCGTRYTANVLQRLKWKPGDDTTPVISFGRFPGLGSGKKYVLFLKYVASANEMLEDLKRYVQVGETNEEALDLVKCKNIVPGYYVDLSKAWEISNKTVIIKNKPPKGMPKKDIKRSSIAGHVVWIVKEEKLVSYIKKLNKQRS